MMLKIKILMFYLWSVIVYICIFTNLPNVFSTILFQNIAFIENNHSKYMYINTRNTAKYLCHS